MKKKEMLTISVLSLSGGQGKTTLVLFLAKVLSSAGYSVLVVDADPQHNATSFLGHELGASDPSLLEVFAGTVGWEDAIYPVEGSNTLFLLPADDSLDKVQDILSSSGIGALKLRQKLSGAVNTFDICLIDSPPQRSQICKSVIVAADKILVPVEATVKGFGSLTRTMDAVEELREAGVCQAELLGVVPFRDRWTGNQQSLESREVLDAMREEVGTGQILPSIRESEQFKQVLSHGLLKTEFRNLDLNYPFEVILERLRLQIGSITESEREVAHV
jgi:chromosome partitioning protein